jgi:8-oxo-dGTP pyrophosphatase MutT (NUDIX family)
MSRTGAPHFDETARLIRESLSGRSPRRLSLNTYRRAAVLITVLRRRMGPTVLFTRRTETVRHHKGQISFPGGGIDPGESPHQAALREAFEEVELDPASVEVVGELDDHLSVSRFIVTPVVGLVSDPPARFVGHAAEVVEPFEVPLSSLLDAERLRVEWWPLSRMPADAPLEDLMEVRSDREEFDPETQQFKVYFFESPLGPDRWIWGLTARVLKELLSLAFGVIL